MAELNQSGALPLHLRNVLSVIKHILMIAAVTSTTANLTDAPLSIQVPSVTTMVTDYMFLMGLSILVRHGPVGESLVEHQNQT